MPCGHCYARHRINEVTTLFVFNGVQRKSDDRIARDNTIISFEAEKPGELIGQRFCRQSNDGRDIKGIEIMRKRVYHDNGIYPDRP